MSTNDRDLELAHEILARVIEQVRQERGHLAATRYQTQAVIDDVGLYCALEGLAIGRKEAQDALDD